MNPPTSCWNRQCGKPVGDFLRCGQCKSAYYCDRKCQKQHWKEHKSICKKEKIFSLLANVKLTSTQVYCIASLNQGSKLIRAGLASIFYHRLSFPEFDNIESNSKYVGMTTLEIFDDEWYEQNRNDCQSKESKYVKNTPIIGKNVYSATWMGEPLDIVHYSEGLIHINRRMGTVVKILEDRLLILFLVDSDFEIDETQVPAKNLRNVFFERGYGRKQFIDSHPTQPDWLND